MKTIKKFFIIIGLIISFSGIVIFILWLRSSGRSLQITPTFEIIDAKKEDTTLLNESIDIAKKILGRMT